MDTEADERSFADDIMADLGQVTPVSSEAAPEQPAVTPAVPETTEQPRNAQGQFVPKPAVVEAAPAVPTPEPPKHEAIPLAVALQWRDEAKEHKAQLEALKAAEAERTAQAQQQIPSPIDEEAYAKYWQDQAQRIAIGSRFDTSELIARGKHGEEAVTGAMSWALDRAKESQAFAAEYLKQRDPIDWAVKQQRNAAVLAEMGDDHDAYVLKRYAELQAGSAPQTPQATTPVAAPQPTPQSATKPPTRSLASAPTAGGMNVPAVNIGPVAAIEDVFPS